MSSLILQTDWNLLCRSLMDVLRMMEMLFFMVLTLSTAISLQTARCVSVYYGLESAGFYLRIIMLNS